MSVPIMSRARPRPAMVGAVALTVVSLAGAPSGASETPTGTALLSAQQGPAAADGYHPAATDLGSISTVVRDADDTDGRLDIRAVRSAVDAATGQASTVRYTVRTHEPFRASALHPRWRRLVLELDTDGRPGAERNVLISARDGRLSALVISNATREVVDRVHVERLRPEVLRISGSPAELGARKLFWTADWHRAGDPSCGEVDGWPLTCQDSVPDDGWLRLDRPAWP